MLEAEAPRVECAEHGVVVAEVPWARAGSGFTRNFEDLAAWLATKTSKTAITELLGVAWRTVGRIVERVVGEKNPLDALKGLRRIGIDETSYRKGHRYILVVVDHDSGALVWAAEGRDKATLHKFFDLLGDEGCAGIEVVSADAASFIRTVVRERCPSVTVCMDPFHVVQWANEALDEVRRTFWRELRASGNQAFAKDIKGSRWALLKNPENLTNKQKSKLSDLKKTNDLLYRAYLLKEQLRLVFHVGTKAGKALLDSWMGWAQRSRIPAFVELQKRIRRNRTEIDAVLTHGVSNGRVESTNTKIKLIARQAFGFHSADALIALAMLGLGSNRPVLPGRS
jgi:transposase